MKSRMFFSTLLLVFFLFNANWFSDHSEASGNLLYRSVSGATLFYEPGKQDFYLLQHLNAPAVPQNLKFVEFNKQNELKARDLNTGNIISYQLDSNIYGISKLSGAHYTQSLLSGLGTGNVAFVPQIDDEIQGISCVCHRSHVQATCTSGGEGATSCSYSYEGGIAPAPAEGSCSVTCAAGYYACCSM